MRPKFAKWKGSAANRAVRFAPSDRGAARRRAAVTTNVTVSKKKEEGKKKGDRLLLVAPPQRRAAANAPAAHYIKFGPLLISTRKITQTFPS